jgi:hypothetical protein
MYINSEENTLKRKERYEKKKERNAQALGRSHPGSNGYSDISPVFRNGKVQNLQFNPSKEGSGLPHRKAVSIFEGLSGPMAPGTADYPAGRDGTVVI